MTQDEAIDALKTLLMELPMEFSMGAPGDVSTRPMFTVIKQRNVRTVHQGLWDLQVYFGIQDDFNNFWFGDDDE